MAITRYLLYAPLLMVMSVMQVIVGLTCWAMTSIRSVLVEMDHPIDTSEALKRINDIGHQPVKHDRIRRESPGKATKNSAAGHVSMLKALDRGGSCALA